MVVGVARPHATVTRAPRGGDGDARDRHVALDGGDRREADAARRRARPPPTSSWRKVPKKYRVGLVSFARARRARGAADRRPRRSSQPALATLQPGEGTALGDAVALALRRRASGSAQGRHHPADVDARDLRRRRARAAGRTPRGRRAPREGAARPRLHRSWSARRTASSQQKLTGGYTQTIRVPPSPQTLQTDRADDAAGKFFTAVDDTGLREVYEQLGSRLGHKQRGARDHRRVRRRGGRAAAHRRRAVGALVPEGPVKRVLAARRRSPLPPPCAHASRRRAGATNECRGFRSACRSPGRGSSSRPRPRCRGRRSQYQLSCPKGYIVGGLDAELSDRAIDVSFLGTLGSPVEPGDHDDRATPSSSRRTSAAGARAPSFRPHIGCMPGAGGGGRASRPSRHVFPPGQPTVAARQERAASHPGAPASCAACARERAARRRVSTRSASAGDAADARAGRAASRATQRRPRRARHRRDPRAAPAAVRARRRPGRRRLRGGEVSFGQPAPAADAAGDPARVVLVPGSPSGGAMRYAVTFTNLDVLASVAGSATLVAALRRRRRSSCSRSRALCVALARPHRYDARRRRARRP